MRGLGMRRVVWCVALLLGGCGGLTGVSPDVDYQVMVRAVLDQCENSPDSYVSPLTAMEVGFTKVQAACEAFFVEATRVQQNALAANHSLDAALIAATAIINPTNSAVVAAKAITIT